MKPYSRADRVGEHIRRAIAELLSNSIHDPRLGSVTISGVDVAADLKLASIHFTLSGDDTARQQALNGFRSAKGFIKRELAQRLGLRYMPELRFFYDTSFDRGDRIERIIHDLNQDNGSDHSAIG